MSSKNLKLKFAKKKTKWKRIKKIRNLLIQLIKYNNLIKHIKSQPKMLKMIIWSEKAWGNLLRKHQRPKTI